MAEIAASNYKGKTKFIRLAGKNGNMKNNGR